MVRNRTSNLFIMKRGKIYKFQCSLLFFRILYDFFEFQIFPSFFGISYALGANQTFHHFMQKYFGIFWGKFSFPNFQKETTTHMNEDCAEIFTTQDGYVKRCILLYHRCPLGFERNSHDQSLNKKDIGKDGLRTM